MKLLLRLILYASSISNKFLYLFGLKFEMNSLFEQILVVFLPALFVVEVVVDLLVGHDEVDLPHAVIEVKSRFLILCVRITTTLKLAKHVKSERMQKLTQ